MSAIVRNVLAVIAGFVVGSLVNMAVLTSGNQVVPPPAGADMATAEGIRAAMSRMEPIHFLVPFLAHALGTLAGGVTAALIAATHKMKFALAIGVIFLAAALVMVRLVGGPVWFIACDLALAYLPMAWLGGKIGVTMSRRTGTARAIAPGHSH
jgi:hypothetical protein